jgi:uncharacterized membrane protein
VTATDAASPVSRSMNADRPYTIFVHPFHAFLLACAVSLFLGATINDLAYYETHQIQWKNFASWLLVGGLTAGGLALAWAFLSLFARRNSRSRPILYFLVLLVVWVMGFVDELVHAKDAWASMPEALILSSVLAIAAIGTTIIGFSPGRSERVLR